MRHAVAACRQHPVPALAGFAPDTMNKEAALAKQEHDVTTVNGLEISGFNKDGVTRPQGGEHAAPGHLQAQDAPCSQAFGG